uniref:G-protein coupled receptors family 1 profile domain-containing protein n=1 Tax=Pyxicephalus adspersus TaxID=30357 RepID=A0AAV3AK12_PYXAD|nr:TPA: hypothetical protein GDO54_009924 [Pyxicephalus adspersus]
MEVKNWTIATELILLGFSKDPMANIFLFLLFSIIYLLTVGGNCVIIYVIIVNTHLHTPMYLFLCNLSFIDLSNTSSAVPKLLIDLFSVQRRISLNACLLQLNVLLLIGATECQLLALTGFVWIFSFITVIMPSFGLPITLCYPNKINHFMCEVLPVIKLSCDDTYIKEIVIFSFSLFSLLPPFLFILTSYICIIMAIIKIPSVGQSKASSTCTSHITVVALYYGTGMVTYFRPFSNDSSNQEKYVSIFYVVIAPMLNPLIYSLNNAEVKKSLKKLF